jgi:hypothetical protein
MGAGCKARSTEAPTELRRFAALVSTYRPSRSELERRTATVGRLAGIRLRCHDFPGFGGRRHADKVPADKLLTRASGERVGGSKRVARSRDDHFGSRREIGFDRRTKSGGASKGA